MGRIYPLASIFLVFFIAACTQQLPQLSDSKQGAKYCGSDSDCVCGGIDLVSKNCFVGNKNYYDSGAVDKSMNCPDFCSGIAGHLVTKCVENNCMIVNNNTFPECSSDANCVPSDCTHASSCVTKSNAPKCEGVFGTSECRQGTLDCGGSCACVAKRCTAKNLYKSDSVPIV